MTAKPPEAQLRTDAHTGRRETVLALLDAGVDPNATSGFDNTALLYAVMHGFSEIASILLARGADPNIANGYGYSPLIMAVLHGNLPIAVELLAYGALWTAMIKENDEVGPVGGTPLSIANDLGHAEITELLVKAGATY